MSLALVAVETPEGEVVEKLLYTQKETEWALGTKHVVTLCERAGWLERVRGGGKLKLFARSEVVECYHRIRREGLDRLKELGAVV